MIDLQEAPGASEALAAARELLPVWVPWLGPAVWCAVACVGGWLSTRVALWRPARRLAAAPEEPWTERARIGWALQRGALIAPLVGAGVGALFAWTWAGPLPVLSLRWLVVLGGLAGYFGGLFGVWRARQAARPIGWGAFLRDVAVEWLLMRSVGLLMPLMLLFMPLRFGPEALVVGVAGFALYFGLARGGSLWLLRRVGWLREPAAELQALGREVAARAGVLEPRLGVLKFGKANALVLPWANEVLVTDTALACLDDDQLRAVLMHEAGHLLEPRGVLLARVAVGALPLPYAFVRPLGAEIGEGLAVLALFLPVVVGLLLFSRMSRRLERDADRVVLDRGEDPGTYLAALEAIYRQNLIPALLKRRGRLHPDLVERFANAGIEPGWPRPEAPRRGELLRVAALLALVWTGLIWPLQTWRDAAQRAAWKRMEVGPALLACTPRHPWLLAVHGYGLAGAGDPEGALVMGRAARALAPRDVWLLLDGALRAVALGAVYEARELLGEAVGRVEAGDPVDPWEVAELARIHRLLGDASEAAARRAQTLALAEQAGVGDGVLARLRRYEERPGI